MVTTLHNIWAKHRKILLLGGIMLVGLLALPHLVHAQGTTPAAESAPTTAVLNSMLAGLSQVMKVIQVVFWPVLLMIGSLLQNDILFGAGMEQRLLDVWVIIRNFVNIFFVLILLGIALYNVVGAGENYHFKTILPKFVIALIAVNFTFIGMKVMLDGVNVVSTAIFGLPSSVQQTLAPPEGGGETSTPAKIGIMTVDEVNDMCGMLYGGKVGEEPYLTNIKNASANAQTICTSSATNGSYLDPKAANFFSTMNSQNAAMVMAISFGKANLLDKVYVNEQNLTLGKLATNTLFSIILYIVYGTAFVALFITLLIRLVALWLMIAISPLIVLPSVLPESIKGMLGEGGELGKKFIKNAIVPIPVALVMSIGYVMLTALKGAKFGGAGTNQILNSINNPTLSLDLLTSGLTTLQEFIIAFAMVGFVWVGVFEAMKGTYAERFTEGIKGMVEGAGKTVGKFALGSIPLFPTARGPATAGAVGAALKQLPALPDTRFREEAGRLFPELMGKGGEIGGKLAQQKDIAGFKKEMGNASKGMFHDKGFQKGFADFFEGPGKKYVNSDLKMWLQKAGYKGTTEQFLKDLKEGKVDPNLMEQIYGAAGVTPSAISGMPATALGAATAGVLSGEAKGLLDKTKRKEMRAKGTLDPAVTDKELDDLDKAIKEGEKAPPGSEKAKKADEAKKRLEEIAKGVKEKDTAVGQVDANVATAIHDRARTVTAEKPADKPTADAIETKLQEEILKISGGKTSGKEYDDAKKKVVESAAKSMTDNEAKGLQGVATGALAEAIAKKTGGSTPAKPGAPGGPAQKPPANPPPEKPAAPPPALPKVKTNDPRLKDMGNPKPGDKVSLPIPGGGTQEYIVE